MRSTYKQFYYINRGRVKADGTTSIFCRITIDGKVSAYLCHAIGGEFHNLARSDVVALLVVEVRERR